jgi:hypothetical protein
MTTQAQPEPVTLRPALLTALALAILTSAELAVLGLQASRQARITALAGLLMAKVGMVFVFFMRGRVTRATSWLAVAAVLAAAGFAVVLMLETAFNVRFWE